MRALNKIKIYLLIALLSVILLPTLNFAKDCIEANFTSQNDKTITACLEYVKNDIVYVNAQLADGSRETMPYPKAIFKNIVLVDNNQKFDLTLKNWNLENEIKDPNPKIECEFTLKNGSTRIANFYELKNDTIFLEGKLQDGSFKKIQIHKEAFSQIRFTNGAKLDLNESNFNPTQIKTNNDSNTTQNNITNDTNYIQSTINNDSNTTKNNINNDTNYIQSTINNDSNTTKNNINNDTNYIQNTINNDSNTTKNNINNNTNSIQSTINNDSNTTKNNSIQEVNIETQPTVSEKDYNLALMEIKSLQQELNKIKSKNKTAVYISTDPEGATISINKVEMLDIAPLNVDVDASKTILIEANWNVNNMLWAGKKIIDLSTYKQDSINVFIKMKKTNPQLKILSTPAKAEIYLDTLASTYIHPRNWTQHKFSDIKPGKHSVQLIKEGYRDTVFSVYVDALKKNSYNISLAKEDRTNFKNQQQEFFKQRKIHKTGQILLYSSIAPLASSIILAVVSKNNYDKASEIKSQLEIPNIQDGEIYSNLKKDNKNYHDKAEKYRYSSYISGLATILTCGVGFLLYF